MRTVYAGAGLALMAGLLLGGAMKPQLGVNDRPEGPQIFAGWPAEHATGPFDDGLSFAAYAGQIPDYVVGTDWKKLVSQPVAAPQSPHEAVDYYESPLHEDDAQPPAEAPRFTPAVYGEQTSDHVSYPSLDGGAAYDDVSRAEKTPVPQATNIDEEAPPEATGDTTPAR